MEYDHKVRECIWGFSIYSGFQHRYDTMNQSESVWSSKAPRILVARPEVSTLKGSLDRQCKSMPMESGHNLLLWRLCKHTSWAFLCGGKQEHKTNLSVLYHFGNWSNKRIEDRYVNHSPSYEVYFLHSVSQVISVFWVCFFLCKDKGYFLPFNETLDSLWMTNTLFSVSQFCLTHWSLNVSWVIKINFLWCVFPN